MCILVLRENLQRIIIFLFQKNKITYKPFTDNLYYDCRCVYNIPNFLLYIKVRWAIILDPRSSSLGLVVYAHITHMPKYRILYNISYYLCLAD